MLHHVHRKMDATLTKAMMTDARRETATDL